jgi:hypothetical protein
VASGFAFSFVREYPLGSVFAQAKKVTAAAQRFIGQIVERIYFVGPRSDQPKVSFSQPSIEISYVVNAKFDFDFVR